MIKNIVTDFEKLKGTYSGIAVVFSGAMKV